MKTKVSAMIVAVASLTWLGADVALAQTGNPWKKNGASGGSNTSSRYAPADLEQKLSAIRPVQPIARPAVPQTSPAQQSAAPAVPLAAPVPNGYPTGGFAPGTGFGYAGVPQGFSGYVPNSGTVPYSGYGYTTIPGVYPGNNGGYFPPGSFFPGGGAAPFGITPFGFF